MASVAHMTKRVDDPRYWRRRAAETRANAGAERKHEIKRKLQDIAKNYEDLADLAEQRARAVKTPRK